MILFLEPIDVWLFRDGRPFDALSDHRAASIFPPLPTVVQGALRSHHLTVRGVDLRDQAAIAQTVGTRDDLRGLVLRGPFLARREQGTIVRYFPQPADAVLTATEPPTLRPASAPEPLPATALSSASTPRLLGLRDAPVKGRDGLWLPEEQLRNYLRGQAAEAVAEACLFHRESRLGIGRDDQRRTTVEGALYEAVFIRPQQDVGLLVEVTGYDGWPQTGSLRIGGEGHGAWFQQVTAAPWPAPPDPLPARFKAYFATPACLLGGWQPAGGDWSPYFEGAVSLVAAAVGRSISAGGFDLMNNEHKPARRYVPAGSVYYFEATGRARLRADRAAAGLTDWGAGMGFGQVFFEEWNGV